MKISKILALSLISASFMVSGCSTLDRLGEAIKKNPEAGGSVIRLSTLALMKDLSPTKRSSLAKNIKNERTKIMTYLSSLGGSQLITAEQIDSYVEKEFNSNELDPVDMELIRLAAGLIKTNLLSEIQTGEVPANAVYTIKFVLDNMALATSAYIGR